MTWFWNWLWNKIYRPSPLLIPCPKCAGGAVKDIKGTCTRCKGNGVLATFEAKILVDFLNDTSFNPAHPSHIDVLEIAMREKQKRDASRVIVPN